MSSNNQQVELPRVLLLATGGTIAGSADNRDTRAHNAGAIGSQQLMAAVSGAPDSRTTTYRQRGH